MPSHEVKKKGLQLPTTAGGWVRFVLYLVLVVVAVARGFAPQLGLDAWEGVLTELLVLLGVVSGGTATVNVPKAGDQRVELREVLPAVWRTYEELQALRQSSATADEVAERVEKRLSAPQRPDGGQLGQHPGEGVAGPQAGSGAVNPAPGGLPVYNAATSRPD